MEKQLKHMLTAALALIQQVKWCFSCYSQRAVHWARQEGHERRAPVFPKKLLSFHDAFLISEELMERHKIARRMPTTGISPCTTN